MTCKSACLPERAIKHAKKCGFADGRGFLEEFHRAVEEHDIKKTTNIKVPRPNSAPVHGLHIYKGFRCAVPRCWYASRKESTIKKHYQEHKEQERPLSGNRLLRTHVQSFFKQPDVKWFSVDPGLSNRTEEDEDDHYELLVQELIPNMPERPVVMSDDNRNRTLLLRVTDWDMHLKPFVKTALEREGVRNLTKLPVEKEEPILFPIRAAFLQYMQFVQNLIKTVPILARRMMMSWPV
jgi:hypothetical protein